MSGGILAWQGNKAFGGEEQGMEFFLDRDFNDAFTMSYAMEESLRQLYLGMIELVDDQKLKDLLKRLAIFEESHKTKLAARFTAIRKNTDETIDTLEGGINRQEIMAHFGPQLKTRQDILELGMMLESQAYDLYSRLARKSTDKKNHELFKYLAKEETQHLSYLASEMDKLL